MDYDYEVEYESTEEDNIIYDKEIEREEIQELENEGVLTPGVDTENENVLEQIYQENIPQTPRRYKWHAAPVHRLELTMTGKTYQTNHLIMQTVEVNKFTIDYKTE